MSRSYLAAWDVALVSGSFTFANTLLIETRQGVTVCTGIIWEKCFCTPLSWPPHFWLGGPSWESSPPLTPMSANVFGLCGQFVLWISVQLDLDENSRFFLSVSCLSHHTNHPVRARKLLTPSHHCLFLTVVGELGALPNLGTRWD